MYLFVLRYYPNVRVKCKFINRSKDIELYKYFNMGTIGSEIEDYREHFKLTLEFINRCKFIYSHLPHEATSKLFKNAEEFAKDLSARYYSRKNADFKIEVPMNGMEEIEVTYEGLWSDVILYETVVMGIVKERYVREHARINNLMQNAYYNPFYGSRDKHSNFDVVINDAYFNLITEVEKYKTDSNGFKFVEFGTRRRLCFDWQLAVNKILAENMPQKYMGSSNAEISYRLGTKPLGTMAHELFMVVAGVNDDLVGDQGILDSTQEVLKKWYEFYGTNFNVALSDTFGTDHFLDTLKKNNLYKKYIGTRQDSGDPYEDTQKKIEFYNEMGENPKDHSIFLSDGLNFNDATRHFAHYWDLINCGYGLGTFLSSNTNLIKNPSIVVKAVEANGKKLVKLSDNIAKATGDPIQVERYKSIFGYDSHYNEQPTV